MANETDLQHALSEHPCFCEDAHLRFARMHIPVAPRCNIQCNYCNRKFDCCNESRPGVTSEVLTPAEAVEKISQVREKIPQLKVIGIAGPGDPLANEATFESLELIRQAHPDLTACVSTNGLRLPENAERLHSLGVNFITVTMNCIDPDIGAKIYDSVLLDGKRLSGVEGAKALLSRQLEGIERCVALGMIVKINIVMVPGINDMHIPDLVRHVKSMGVYIVNILPLIPVEGTRFAGMRAPSPAERRELMDRCSLDAKMMRHCRQCRADAIGLLGEDRSQEFSRGCGCSNANRPNVSLDTGRNGSLFAVASSDGVNVDRGFGNTPCFLVFSAEGGEVRQVRRFDVDTASPVAGSSHRSHVESIVRGIEDCGTVIVKEIGPLPSRILAEMGISVSVSESSIEEAIGALRS